MVTLGDDEKGALHVNHCETITELSEEKRGPSQQSAEKMDQTTTKKVRKMKLGGEIQSIAPLLGQLKVGHLLGSGR